MIICIHMKLSLIKTKHEHDIINNHLRLTAEVALNSTLFLNLVGLILILL